MFGSHFVRDFEDPFFSAQQQHMNHMQSMIQPFDMMMGGPTGMPAITAGPGRQQGGARPGPQRSAPRPQATGMVPFQPMADPFGDMFGNMNRMMQGMMGNMNQMMEQARNQPNAHFYSQSSVMTYSNTGEGEPRLYQATSSTRQAPGGVREIRKSVRDSESGVEKMAVGRHLDERGHVITRSRNTRTNDMNEDQDYINLDESEGGEFDREWQGRAARGFRTTGPSRHRAVTDRYAPHHRPSHDRRRPTPALTYHPPAAPPSS